MRKCNQIIVAGGAIISCYPGLLLADTCTTLPKCPDLGFSVAKSDLATKCAEKTYLKCPFGDYYFCSDVDDGCPEFVTVNPATEVCTKYCPKNSSKCLTKRTISCSEAVSKANGRLVQDNYSICGTQTRNIYLLGKANSNCSGSVTAEYTHVSVYPASNLPPCKNEMKGEAYLEGSYIRIKDYASFYVKTKFNSVNFSGNNSSGTITLGEDAEIRNIEGYANTVYTGNYNISVYNSDKPITVKLGASCGCSSSSGWYPPTCNVNINGDNATVKYNQSHPSGGLASCKVNFTCNIYDGKCEEGWW